MNRISLRNLVVVTVRTNSQHLTVGYSDLLPRRCRRRWLLSDMLEYRCEQTNSYSTSDQHCACTKFCVVTFIKLSTALLPTIYRVTDDTSLTLR
jgi:hypothetical protein